MTDSDVAPSAAQSFERSRQLAAAAERVIPGGVNSTTRKIGPPYAIADARGAFVTDLDGNRYLDYHAAFGAMLLGHRAPDVDAAVRASEHAVGLAGIGVTAAEVELAELVGEVMPGVEQMLCLQSGSEAIVQAVRLARAVTGRKLLVKFQGCFHGWSDPVARNVISPADRAYRMDPLSAGILGSALEQTLVAEFNDIDSVQALFAEHGDDIAAVVVEPIPHNVGALVPTAEFLSGLRSITSQQGSLLIFDEVITGFRHAIGGYQQVCGVRPDVTTFGKAMGNGYPVAGIGGSRELMAHFDSAGGDVLVAGTFNGNGVSCAAAVATITHLRDNPDFYERTFRLGERVRDGLAQIAGELAIPLVVAGYGGVFSLYFLEGTVSGYRDLLRNNNRASVEFARRMTERGILMLPIALKRNHVSGAHTDADIDHTLEVAGAVLKELAADGVTGQESTPCPS